MPDEPRVVWRKALSSPAMAGLAATEQFVIVADRDPLDTQDVFRCLRAGTGDEVWTLGDVCPGALDYGNAPRATPQIVGDLVYLYNAFGRLHCVRLATGEIVWKRDLLREFAGQDADNHWGTAASPLWVDGLLVVNPGGPVASIAALRPETGEVVWKSPGDKAAFSSFIVATLGGRRQIVGYEKAALVGLDPATGERLWRLTPPRAHDFNVPTPIEVDGKLLVVTENNGARLYAFDEMGRIMPEPVAENEDLAPDSHTPVVVGGRVFGVWGGLHCLDLSDGLKTLWIADDAAFDNYAVAIAGAGRVLVISQNGELVLLDPAANEFAPISRLPVFEDDPGVYAHPAIVGGKIYLRGSNEIVCVDLAPKP